MNYPRYPFAVPRNLSAIRREFLSNVTDRILNGIMLRFHNVRDRCVLPAFILHLALLLEVMQIKGHLRFLHLMGRIQ
jgi:hypothetical protein